jgi:hypothetical protein
MCRLSIFDQDRRAEPSNYRLLLFVLFVDRRLLLLRLALLRLLLLLGMVFLLLLLFSSSCTVKRLDTDGKVCCCSCYFCVVLGGLWLSAVTIKSMLYDTVPRCLAYQVWR